MIVTYSEGMGEAGEFMRQLYAAVLWDFLASETLTQ